ncbi:MAG: SGNH/GDSL hydrolase family protein [Oscillospiraceae bacterium]|nr:SGNH/GDSL hydrolase family protein [Oscillospiraceae bacterium]
MIAGVNYEIDKYGLLRGGRYERQLVETLQAGQAVAGYDESMLDEREIMRLYIQTMEKKDYIVLGSSRGLQLTQDYVPAGSSFFNLGVSGSDFRDMLGLYYLLEKNDKLPAHLILVLDPWLLFNSPDAFSKRSNIELYKEFLAEGLGLPVEYEKPDYSLQLEALLSPSIFQENIRYYFRDRTGEDEPLSATGNWYAQDTTLRLPDGSQLYDVKQRSRSQNEIDFDALAVVSSAFFRVEDFRSLDEELTAQLEAFIRHIKAQGVQITFVLTPYHPTTYEIALRDWERFPAFFEMEDYYRALAKKEGITLYGSFDPDVSGCKSADFYDGLHIKRESLYKIFPGFEGSEIYKKVETIKRMQKNALQQIEEQRAQGIDEPWMEEFEAALNLPAKARRPNTF